VELFIDWHWKAVGTEIFQNDASIEGKLRLELENQGWGVKSWDRELYKERLISWKMVHSPGDFWRWIQKSRVPVEGKWVFWNLGKEIHDFDFAKAEKEKLALVVFEPPVVQPELHDSKMLASFGKIFTWDDDLVDNVRFFKVFYPALKQRIEKLTPFAEKKFCTLIATRLSSKHPKELYSEREAAIRFFEAKGADFDLYGRGWEKRRFKCWKGTTPDKIETLKNYKFCICYENTRDMNGYITEKIFDCLASGAVPIYWGADNISEFIPKECFIDRRTFKTMDELYTFLSNMSQEDYEVYLEAAGAFLKSEQAQVFTHDYFIKNFVSKLL
jgi:hypothetical protein